MYESGEWTARYDRAGARIRADYGRNYRARVSTRERDANYRDGSIFAVARQQLTVINRHVNASGTRRASPRSLAFVRVGGDPSVANSPRRDKE